MKKLGLFFISMFSILLIGIGTISCAKKSVTGPPIAKKNVTSIVASIAAMDPEKEYDCNAEDGWIWVSKPEHIKWISDTVNDGNSLKTKKYKFKNDISFNGAEHNPIGYDSHPFKGKIDGNGKSFKEAKIVANHDYVGFIGYLYYGGEIINLTIDSSVEINVSAKYVGAVVGYAYRGKITDCVNKAGITNNDKSDYPHTGGIAGVGLDLEINSSYNLGNIFVTYKTYFGAGGIIGCAQFKGISITKCYNAGNITLNSTSGSSGGIAGYSDGDISDSYNTGKVSGGRYSGGIIGNVGKSTLVLKNVYSTTVPDVYSKNDKHIGGIVGHANVDGYSITKSYFVKGSTLVPDNGHSSSDNIKQGDDANRTKKTDKLANLLTEFDNKVWKSATINGIARPVLIGIGEGK